MSIFAWPDGARYDEADELIADLEKLVNCGLVTRVRRVGGPTRYSIAPPDDDHGGGELEAARGAVFSAG